MSPAVSVEDQGLAAGKDPTSKTDLGSAEGGEAVVGGEARAGETLREKSREGLGGKLTGWTAETWVTSLKKGRRGHDRRARGGCVIETLKNVKDIK